MDTEIKKDNKEVAAEKAAVEVVEVAVAPAVKAWKERQADIRPDDSVATTKEKEDGVVSAGAKAGAAIGAVVALLGLAFLAKKFISKPKTEGTPDADAAVVRKGDLDNTLEIRTDSTV